MKNQQKVAIVGGNGYAGLELTRLLLHHPQVELSAVFTRNSSTWHPANDLPELTAQTITCYPIDDLAKKAHEFAVIFLATPASVSMTLANKIFDKGIDIIDLSGAFRLSAHEFTQWYAKPHTATDLIEQAQYGLCPWWVKSEKKTSQLIANPGCFATCSLMALIPLLKAHLINSDSIVIDAKSGISGAGRKVHQDLLFCEIANDFYPYKTGQHQHTPEIVKYLDIFANTKSQPLLTTHILPIKRGLFTSIYTTIASHWLHLTTHEISTMIHNTYINAYKNYPLIKLNGNHLSTLKTVTGSARTHINYHIVQDKIIIFACIDNLLKGAASQAIENFNALYNLPLETGLLHWEGTL